MKRVMVFGVFDRLHEGHRAFLRQARRCGDSLLAVVARDDVVEKLKGRLPRQPLAERMAHLEAEKLVDAAVEGDAAARTWNVLKIHRPDVIALGYDQTELKAELEAHCRTLPRPPELTVLEAYEPTRYHTSLLTERG